MRARSRFILAAGLCGWIMTCGAATAAAQEWAEKMFKDKTHEFGSVARAANVEYAFEMVNPYKEDIHVSGVRASCGCTLPRIQKDTLKSWEKGAIIAEFNTRSFSGQRGARITVTIDKPFYAEVQLQVHGYIRTDIVVDPGQVALGQVPTGTGAERSVTIDYAGRSDWQILGVEPNSPYLHADVTEVSRQNGRVAYKLAVSLDKSAPPGYLADEVILRTNDRRSPQFPVKVEGYVLADLTVSPSSLMLGILQPGQKITKQIVIKAREPFHVLAIDCPDKSFSFRLPTEAKTLHLVPLTFEAGKDAGKIVQKITIQTDLSGGDAVAELSAYGQVVAPLAGK